MTGSSSEEATMKKSSTRPPKRRSDGIRRAPGPIGRSVRVVDRGLPPEFFIDRPPRRGTRRLAARVPEFAEDVTVRRSPGRPPSRSPRAGAKRGPPRDY